MSMRKLIIHCARGWFKMIYQHFWHTLLERVATPSFLRTMWYYLSKILVLPNKYFSVYRTFLLRLYNRILILCIEHSWSVVRAINCILALFRLYRPQFLFFFLGERRALNQIVFLRIRQEEVLEFIKTHFPFAFGVNCLTSVWSMVADRIQIGVSQNFTMRCNCVYETHQG